jgi:hypothetical protein
MIWLITCHVGWIALFRSSHGLRTAFDAADVVLGIMSRAVAVSVVAKSDRTVKDPATWVSNGYPVDNETTAFFLWDLSALKC